MGYYYAIAKDKVKIPVQFRNIVDNHLDKYLYKVVFRLLT